MSMEQAFLDAGFSASDLAAKAGVSPQAVRQWFNGTRQIKPSRCIALEEITGVRREVMRPDLFARPDERGAA